MTQTSTAAASAPVRNRIFPCDFETAVRPDGQILVTATDDNPSIVGSMLLTEGAAKRLLDSLASALGYVTLTVEDSRALTAHLGRSGF